MLKHTKSTNIAKLHCHNFRYFIVCQFTCLTPSSLTGPAIDGIIYFAIELKTHTVSHPMTHSHKNDFSSSSTSILTTITLIKKYERKKKNDGAEEVLFI